MKNTKKPSKPIYLDEANIKIPYNAMVSIQKELIHLYENAQKAILHAISIHSSELKTEEDITRIINSEAKKIDTDLDSFYQNNLKLLYSEIIEFTLLSQQNMNKEQNEYVAQLKTCFKYNCKDFKGYKRYTKKYELLFK